MKRRIVLIVRKRAVYLWVILSLFAVSTLSGQEHAEDSGSTELGHLAQSQITNIKAAIFAGLPDDLRLMYMERLEVDYQDVSSDEERGTKLLTLAGDLMANDFPEQAQRLFRALAIDTSLSPRTQAEAWITAGEMAPLYWKVDDGAECFQKSVELIESIPEAERTWTDSYVQLSGLAKLANKLYCTDMNSPELPVIYRRILEFEPTHGDANVRRFLTVAMDASRILRERSEPEEASIYLRLAEKYVEKDPSLSLPYKISILFETSSGLYEWNDPARIRKLREMWDDEKYLKQPEVMRIGNEILWAMFLEREVDRNPFEEFAEEFNKRGSALLEAADFQSAEDVSIFGSQGAAALAVSKHETKNQSAIEPLRDMFLEFRHGDPVVGRFPGNATREEQKAMADAFYLAVTELFKFDLNKPVPAKKNIPAPDDHIDHGDQNR